jgi:ketosteroid isomerase-like protein
MTQAGKSRHKEGSAAPQPAARRQKTPPNPEDALREGLENWRKAWQEGNLDLYSAFYAPQAQQNGRTGIESIRRHKRSLWPKAAPKTISLSEIHSVLAGNTATVSMRQRYSDSRGRSDTGIKTLVWQQSSQGWHIVKETWIAAP